MSEFTYENNPTGNLETYEWDNVWWEKTKNTDKGRIMYIGDSISCGIRNNWNKIDGIEWYDDNCATSKALDNPYLLPLAVNFGRQQAGCDTILVNNGLHGWHLSTEDYASCYEKFLLELKDAFPERRVLLVTTTSVSNNETRNNIVIERNKAATLVAEKLGINVIDVYPLSTTLTHVDGVHLDANGYIALCELIRSELKAL